MADVVTDDSPYGYTPTLYVCAIFIGLFSTTSLIHVAQATRYRLWWLFPTICLAGLGEVIGWVGRLWSSKAAENINPFLMQICATIIAPTPLVAANFIVLGMIIREFGTHYSRLSPRLYTIVFLTADMVALIVQAIGGASASQAAQENRDASTGGNIMLGGIVFQLFAITIYVCLAAEFLFRLYTKRPCRAVEPGAVDAERLDRRARLVVIGLAVSTLFIFIRAIYRTVELVDGWTGYIITTEVYFNVLDGAMIVLAMFTLNVLHPGLRFGRRHAPVKTIDDNSATFIDEPEIVTVNTEGLTNEKGNKSNLATGT